MEGVLLLLIVVVSVVFAASKVSGASHKSTSVEKVKQPAKKFDQPFAPSNVTAFDAKSAKHVSKTRVILGRAYVIDGDTVVIKKTQIRLFGVDAPEMNHPFGIKAKWALVGLCKGQNIRAEVTETDAYGRTVARCYLEDGRDLSAEMVKCGLAIDWAKFSGGCYRRLEIPDARKKMWLADARQKGRMHVWEKFEARQGARK